MTDITPNDALIVFDAALRQVARALNVPMVIQCGRFEDLDDQAQRAFIARSNAFSPDSCLDDYKTKSVFVHFVRSDNDMGYVAAISKDDIMELHHSRDVCTVFMAFLKIARG